jgi:hypothetical protein
MRTVWRIGLAAWLLCALAGCGKDKSTGPEPRQVTGVWHATKVEYVRRPAGEAVDLVALGGSGTLTLNADDSFRLVITPFAAAESVTEGTWTLGGDTLDLTPLGMSFSWQFDVALVGDSLGLSGASVEYDFDDDGTPDQATLNLLLVR